MTNPDLGLPEMPEPPPADDPDGPGDASPNSPNYNPDKDPYEGMHPPRPDGTPVPVNEPNGPPPPAPAPS